MFSGLFIRSIFSFFVSEINFMFKNIIIAQAFSEVLVRIINFLFLSFNLRITKIISLTNSLIKVHSISILSKQMFKYIDFYFHYNRRILINFSFRHSLILAHNQWFKLTKKLTFL